MPRVLVVDSGVGGLTIVPQIRIQRPDLSITFLADNAAFPYGRLEAEELTLRLVTLVTTIQDEQRFDAVVIACSTASTTMLEAVRTKVACPVVGVVPAIKPAAAVSKTRVIGLLATAATVDRPYVARLVDEFAADCQIVRIGSSELAPMAEDLARGHEPSRGRLQEILAPFFGTDAPAVDTVVLGCTHYPLLLDHLKAVAPRDVAWIDPAPAVARRLATVLPVSSVSSGRMEEGERALFTAKPKNRSQLNAFVSRFGFSKLELLDLKKGAAVADCGSR